MKKLFITLLIATAASAQTQPAVSVSSSSGQDFLVAAGSSNHTYETMLGELIKVCGPDVTGLNIKVSPSKGTVQNLSDLLDNKVNAAFVHTDMLFYHNQSRNISQKVQTLLAMYPEEVHFVALRNSKATTAGNALGFGKKPIVFNDISYLQSRKVGAVEGGAITAEIIAAKTDLNFTVVNYHDAKEMQQALENGDIDAYLTIGGAPLKSVSELDGNTYKLLPIPDAYLPKLSEAFRAAQVLYPNMGKDHVSTVSADALLIVRPYKTPKMVAALSKFRDCFYKNLEELKEITGNHAKWQEVDPEDQGTWTWYVLPTDAASSHGTAAKVNTDPPKRVKRGLQ